MYQKRAIQTIRETIRLMLLEGDSEAHADLDDIFDDLSKSPVDPKIDPKLGPNLYKSSTGEYVYVPNFNLDVDLSKLPDPWESKEKEEETPDMGDAIPYLASEVRANPSRYGIGLGKRKWGKYMEPASLAKPGEAPQEKPHDGHDYTRFKGAGIVAAADGVVVDTAEGDRSKDGQPGGSWGREITIDHQDGTYTHYAHLNDILVANGASVSAGDIIGAMGESGRSEGPHLHFRTLNSNKKAYDPEVWYAAHPNAIFPVSGKSI